MEKIKAVWFGEGKSDPEKAAGYTTSSLS